MNFEGIIQSCSNVSKLNFVVALTGDRHGSGGQKSLVEKEDTLVLLNRSRDEIFAKGKFVKLGFGKSLWNA